MRKVFVLALLLPAVACVHQPAILPAPHTGGNPVAPACDTLSVVYASDIKPIFQQNCYSCHGSAVVSSASLNLEDTTSLKKYLQLGFRGDGIYGSKLYHCLLHSAMAQPMPPTYVLDSCALHKLHHWLAVGAPM